jgi:integrase
MARTVHDAPLTTRAARARLAEGVHWRNLGPDVHLGYRKSGKGGRWLVRWRKELGYRQDTIGAADDVLEADGGDTLSFAQAERLARKRVETARADEAAAATGPVPTVRSAIEHYCSAVEARQREAGRRPLRDARSRLGKHVLSSSLADTPLHQLQAEQIAEWRDGLRAQSLSPTTIHRIVNDFRAALNESAKRLRLRLPDGFSASVRGGFAATARDGASYKARQNVILTIDDVRRVISSTRKIDEEEGWEGDLYRLVLVLAATGLRYSQIARIAIHDVQFAASRIMVPPAYKGRPGSQLRAPIPAVVGADVLDELRPAVAGRKGADLLLTKWGYRRDDGTRWVKDHRRGWQREELNKPFRRIVARAGLSSGVTAYALRHSSIVRGLTAGLPVRLVASLHDTSSEMIEKHYSAWIADALSQLAARAVVPLAG